MTGANLTSMVIADAAADAALIEDWRGLRAPWPYSEFFLSPSFLAASGAAVDRETPRALALARESGGRLVGLMPLSLVTVRRGPALSVRFDLHPGDSALVTQRSRYRLLPVRQVSSRIRMAMLDLRGGYLVAPDIAEEVALAALLRGLGDKRGWDVGVFAVPVAKLAMWRAIAQELGLPFQARTQIRRFFSSSIATWDDLASLQSRNFRKNLARAERRAEELGLRITALEGAANVEAQIAALRHVGQLSWKSREGETGDVFAPWSSAQEALIRGLAAAPDVRLGVFTLGAEEPSAVLSAFIHQGRITGGWVFYRDEIAEVSPMRLLMRAAFHWGAAHGATAFDMNATDPWVQPFADQTEDFAQVLLFSRGPRGRLLDALSRRAAARDIAP